MRTVPRSQLTEPVVFPTSRAQERLWMAEQIDGHSSAYMLVDILLIRGSLDEGALRRALAHLTRRHEGLRTTLALLGGTLVQVVHPPSPFDLEVVEATRDTDLDALARAEVEQPFDTERGPLFRARLVRRAPDDHVLVLATHHVVSDGWSLAVFNRELSALYRAEAAGEPADLADPALQYGDVAAWQRAEEHGMAQQPALDHWHAELGDAPRTVTWAEAEGATDHAARGARVPVTIDAETASAIRAAARHAACTEFMWFLAAFAGALAGFVEDEDVVVGAPVANRDSPALHNLVGFLVNMIPLRVRGVHESDHDALLQRVREATLQGLRHQSLPFDELVRHLKPPREGRHPLFQTVLAFQNTPAASWDLAGLDVETAHVDPGISMYEATLYLEPRGAGYGGYLEHSCAAVAPATAAAIVDAFTERASQGTRV